MTLTALEALIEALKRLPGVGQKSAQRMAYHLLQHDRLAMPRLAEALAASHPMTRTLMSQFPSARILPGSVQPLINS